MKENVFESGDRFALLGKVLNPFSRKGFFDLSRNMPKTYYGLCVLLAVSGYIFFLSLPYLAVSLPVSIYHGVKSVAQTEDWILPVVEMAALILCLMIIYSLTRISFDMPRGLELKREKFTSFYALLDQLMDHYQSRLLRIDRVVLSDKFEISLVQTPKYPLPIVFTRTLVIGVPVLLTMKPEYFHALMARKIGQASMKHNMLSGWLAGLASVWPQYARAGRKAGFVAIPLYWFFKGYSALYNAFMLGVIRDDELQADIYALELVNDQDVLEVLSYELVIREFLKNRYWPNIIKMCRRMENPEILPYANMGKVARKGVNDEVYKEIIDTDMGGYDSYEMQLPPLHHRIENLGHHKPALLPAPFTETAAERYLETRLDIVISKLDKHWLMKLNKARQDDVVR